MVNAPAKKKQNPKGAKITRGCNWLFTLNNWTEKNAKHHRSKRKNIIT